MVRRVCSMLLAVLVVASIGTTCAVAAGRRCPAVPHYVGRVTAVDATAGTLTIERRKAAAMTFTLAQGAAVFVDKSASSLANVQVGMGAWVKSADGTTALVVRARILKGHRGKK